MLQNRLILSKSDTFLTQSLYTIGEVGSQFEGRRRPATRHAMVIPTAMADAAASSTVLTSFHEAEPVLQSYPLKVGDTYYPPGTCFKHDGKICRLISNVITTTTCTDVSPAEAADAGDGAANGIPTVSVVQKALFNVFVDSSSMEGVPALRANQCKHMNHVVQTLQAKKICVPVHTTPTNMQLHYLFKYADLDGLTYLAQGRDDASACRYRQKSDGTIEEVPVDMVMPFPSSHDVFRGDDPCRRYWIARDSILKLLSTALRRKKADQAAVDSAMTVSPLLCIRADEWDHILGLVQRVGTTNDRPLSSTMTRRRGEGVVGHGLQYSTREVKKGVTVLRFQGPALGVLERMFGETALIARHRPLSRKHPSNLSSADRQGFILSRNERVSVTEDDGQDVADGISASSKTDRYGVDLEYQRDEHGGCRIKVRSRHECAKAHQVERSAAYLQALAEARTRHAVASVEHQFAPNEETSLKEGRRFLKGGITYRIQSVEGETVIATCRKRNETVPFSRDEVQKLVNDHYEPSKRQKTTS